MIAFLTGNIAKITQTQLLLDVGGVGYAVSMSQKALGKLSSASSPITVLTYLQVSDTAIALYGFLDEREKMLFENLIAINSVGPKVALAALSTFDPQELMNAVAVQDVSLVSKIPGVGKKTASRIILELKGSLESQTENLFSSQEPTVETNEAVKGATEALLAMGFTQSEAELALKGVPADAPESTMLRYALKRLGN